MLASLDLDCWLLSTRLPLLLSPKNPEGAWWGASSEELRHKFSHIHHHNSLVDCVVGELCNFSKLFFTLSSWSQAFSAGIGPTAKVFMSNRTSAAKKPLHSLFESVVFVDVGSEHQRYAIHKGLLCSRSGYFKAALTGNFREAEDQVVTLDDEDPETFRRFNAWLYTDVLVEDADPGTRSWSSLFNIYIFAEKRIIPLLQNTVIDSIIHLNALVRIPVGELRHVWSRTAESSLLRKLLVDIWLNENETFFTNQFQSHIDQYDITFVAAVAIRAAELISLEYDRYKPDTREDVLQWLDVLRVPWRFRCHRYHIHEPLLETPCEGSV